MSDLLEEVQITQAVAGDRDALSQLLHQYAATLRTFLGGKIARRWQSLLDVDDVIQVTLLEIFLRIGKFEYRGQGSFAAWLQRIASNNLKDAIRSLEAAKQLPPEKRLTLAGSEDSSRQLLEILGVTTGTPSRKAMVKETDSSLRNAIQQLPRDYAQVLTLYDLESQTVEQVAETMRRSVGAVFMLRARGLDYLRETLGSESQL